VPYKPATHRQAHQSLTLSLALSLSLSKTEGCALQTYSARAFLSPDTANVPTPFVGESPWPSLITPAKTKESPLHHQKNIQDLEFPACSQQRLCHHHSQLSITRTQTIDQNISSNSDKSHKHLQETLSNTSAAIIPTKLPRNYARHGQSVRNLSTSRETHRKKICQSSKTLDAILSLPQIVLISAALCGA
jgi:hypothetical protein